MLITREKGECHTGVYISDRLLEAAKEWGITDERVSALVSDNAAYAVSGLTGGDILDVMHVHYSSVLMLVLIIPQ